MQRDRYNIDVGLRGFLRGVSGPYIIGPLGDGATRLLLADVAASPGEQSGVAVAVVSVAPVLLNFSSGSACTFSKLR